MITYSSITITDLEEASQFWTTSQDPTTPDYTFTIANLTGDTNADIKVGDIIFHSHYRYMVLSVDTTTVRAGDRVSIKGADAISPTIKSIVCSHAAAVCGKDGTYNPTTIQFSGQTQQGETIEAYNGYFVIDISSDGSTWVRNYAPTTKATSTNYTIPLGVNISKNGVIYSQGTVSQSGTVLNTNFTITSEGVVTTTEDVGFIIRSIRCSLYADYDNSNQTYSNLVDQQRINIAFDGVDGNKGDDAYSVTLTNENYTFSGNTTSAVASNISTGFNVAECNVIAYYGGVQIPCYIGTITGMPTGMDNPNNSITGQNSNNAKFAVTVTNTMKTQNGVLNIPVILNKNTTDEKTFNMKFSYSLKLNGLDSTGLGLKVNYSNLSTVANGKCVYYAFEDGTKQPVIDNNVNGWVMWNGQEVLIPTGCYINPLATMPTGQTIYSVYRLNNASNLSSGGVFHDVTWNSLANTWSSNTYSGSTATSDSVAWVWDEAKDIILAVYVLPSSGAITNIQLFTPPKKYSELVEPAKGMANEASKVASNYIATFNPVGSTGGIYIHRENDADTPSDSTANGVLITDQVDIIRSGKSVAEFSDNIRIGQSSVDSQTGVGQKNIYIDSNGVNIREGTTSVAYFGDTARIGEDNGNKIVLENNSFIGTKHMAINNVEQNVEVFNISTSGGNIVEVSPFTVKSSGDTVTVVYTCQRTPDSPSTIYMYADIMLVSGELKYTKPVSRLYNETLQNSGYSGFNINWKENPSDIGFQSLSCRFDYVISSKQITMTVNDENCNENNKILSARIGVMYLESSISYPRYRFGVYNAYNQMTVPYIAGDFSFDIGENNIPSGNYCLTHGVDNHVYGFGSLASGGYCVVHGDYSMAEGNGCSVSGSCAGAIGLENIANGDYSFVVGRGNVSRYDGQTVVGNYAPLAVSNDLFIVGNGQDVENRSYAMRLKNDGRAEFGGAVGSGLAWDSRTEMIQVVGELSLNRPYNFFATSKNTGSGTIYWSTVAGAEDSANAFGTICKMSTTTWQIYFMCSGKFYTSVFNLNTSDPTQSTFATNKLLT